MEPVLDVKHLTKYFGDRAAVQDLSFQVPAGEIYGFLGQNGAGKSTTIRMLLTLVKPSEGSIRFWGMDLQKHRRDILKKIGAVVESPDLYGYLSALENLSIFARLSGLRLSRQALLHQLDQVGLADRSTSPVKTYSQGMKQRLGLAVALVHNPSLIILDEPTNGLDPQGIADVRNLILDLSRRQGKTVLISSHLLSEMEILADRVLIIDQGTKRIEGKIRDLLDPGSILINLRVANAQQAQSLVANSPWQKSLQRLEGDRLIFSLSEHQTPQLVADLSALGVAILSLEARRRLEEYFLSLTTPNQHVASFAN